jgi:hypothetical protein
MRAKVESDILKNDGTLRKGVEVKWMDRSEPNCFVRGRR